MKRIVQSAYDRDATDYDARFTSLQRPKFVDLLGAHAERLAGAAQILDAGCGTGLLFEFLAQRGVDARGIIGVDFSYIYPLEENHPLANTMRFSLLVGRQ